jgi:predicted metal-dependent hydrolase
VRIAVPRWIPDETIRLFAISKLSWIRKQQKKFEDQVRETPREYLNRESHYLWGQRYLLRVIETDAPPTVEVKPQHIILKVRPSTPLSKKREIFEEWNRDRLKEAIRPLIGKWEKIIGVHVAFWGVKKMKTKWGSCNITDRRIWLNLDLVRKTPSCLEYVIVHEMIHLLERKHGDRFIALMNQYLPQWKQIRGELNSFPLAHAEWLY